MRTDEAYTRRGSLRIRRFVRRVFLLLISTFMLWLVLANHVIIVTDDFSLVILQKTSWTLDGGFIGESSWPAFTLHHPILMSRLAAGQGVWIVGGSP